MRIAIISAEEAEIAGVRTLGAIDGVEYSGSQSFYLQTIQGLRCVSAVSSVGKVAAAQTMSVLAERYRPSHAILVGTAGALQTEAQIGDVVIADCLFQHDVDLRPFRPRFELGISGKTFFHSNVELVNHAKQAIQDFLKSDSFSANRSILNAFGITSPNVLNGMIATGDQFFSEHYAQYKKELSQVMPKAIATEMEGAAIAQVCDDFNIPFVVLRFISDRADGSASINYLGFLNQIAAWYGKEIVSRLIQQLKNSEY